MTSVLNLGFSRPNTFSWSEVETRKAGRTSLASQSGGREATCSVPKGTTARSSRALTQLFRVPADRADAGVPFTDIYLVANFSPGLPGPGCWNASAHIICRRNTASSSQMRHLPPSIPSSLSSQPSAEFERVMALRAPAENCVSLRYLSPLAYLVCDAFL